MPSLSFQPILDYRAQTFRTAAGRRIATKEEAIAFVNERGYVYFWPIKEVTLPSLWAAVAGDRPVPDEHDDPGHVTWGWKDELLGAAVVLRQGAAQAGHFHRPGRGAPFLCPLGELRRAGQGLPAAIPGGPADLGGEDCLRDDLERGGAGYRQPAQAGPHDHQGQQFALQPRAGNPPGGLQDPRWASPRRARGSTRSSTSASTATTPTCSNKPRAIRQAETADSLPQLICLVDKNGSIIRANRVVETWGLGSVQSISGLHFHRLLHPRCSAYSCYLQNLLQDLDAVTSRGRRSDLETLDLFLGEMFTSRWCQSWIKRRPRRTRWSSSSRISGGRRKRPS